MREATGFYFHTRVAGHVEVGEAPTPGELTRYSAVVGLSSERLLSRADKDGVGDARQDELPRLDPTAREWLRSALLVIHPDDAWLPLLARRAR